MSIYISGIEMPTEGNETIIRILSDGTVLDQYGHHLGLKAVLVPESPQTNYDRITSKTLEELAELLNKNCPPKTTASTCERMFDKETCKYNCVKCWIEWLSIPVIEVNEENE